MPRESHEAKAARTRQFLAGLKQTYPDAHCELNYSNPLELLIATILSAQCTDKQVNIVTAKLFQKYKTAADYANAPPPDLEQDLRRCYARTPDCPACEVQTLCPSAFRVAKATPEK